MTDDFFRNRLDQKNDLRRPLAVLANRMPWHESEASLAQRWARQVKAGKKIEDLDLFGLVSAMTSGGVSNAGRPRLPTLPMVDLLYLKHALNESDEDVIHRWCDIPTATWQYFSGNEYFEHHWPCEPTHLGRFRKALGEADVEELLARTMEMTVTLKLIATKALTRVIVDSTVQEKAVAHLTDSKLLQTARAKVVVCADLGYRGVDKDNSGIEIKHRGKDKRLIDEERRLLKRRQAIEPIIGHLKESHRMDRYHLKGAQGDALHAVQYSAAYSTRWLLRMIDKKGLGLLLCLLQVSGLAGLFEKLAEIFDRHRLQNSDQRWALT